MPEALAKPGTIDGGDGFGNHASSAGTISTAVLKEEHFIVTGDLGTKREQDLSKVLRTTIDSGERSVRLSSGVVIAIVFDSADQVSPA